MPEPRRAFVAHVLPGRCRIKVPSARGDAVYCADLGAALAVCPAVRSAAVNPRTGSVLIGHDGPLAAVVGFAHARGLFVVPSLEPSLPSVRDELHAALLALDGGLRRASSGAVDLGAAIALAFLGLAASQLRRGSVLVPALPLVWNSLVLLGLAAINSNHGRVAAVLGNGGSADG